jgi:hypothetical protein
MKHSHFLLALSVSCSARLARADEGMWLISNLSARTDSVCHAMGLELTHDEIFSTTAPSLSNAIVQFGGFCSGSVVSPDGLVFTNHHCGFGAIQDHSSLEHDYLRDGFSAKRLKDELPNEGLFVDFHINTYEVTDRILSVVHEGMDELQRATAMDSVAMAIEEALADPVRSIHAEVVPYYKGSKYYVSIYQRFNDVRLVFAPPQCLGKHGGDTDNWMWPRQTCDFSVFRIYADANNMPADYSPANRPYRPVRYAHISVQGYQPGDFVMTFGYPGSTDRYLSSFGIENLMNTTNELRYNVRDVKLAILRKAMAADEAIRIMYASKYAQSSNYWKFSLGQNKALRELNVVDEKRSLEREVIEWAKQKAAAAPAGSAEQARYLSYVSLPDSLQNAYHDSFRRVYAYNLWVESFYSGSDILSFVLRQMLGAMRDSQEDSFKKDVEKAFKDIHVPTDKAVFAALLKNYVANVPDTTFLPEFCKDVQRTLEGDYDAFVNVVYERSVFARPEEIMQKEHFADVIDDPITEIAMQLLGVFRPVVDVAEESERLLGDAIREMNHDKEYYPDANFTLRMSFGQVGGYNDYACFTPSQSIIDKFEQQGDNPDYELTPPVYKWLKAGRWGKRYVDAASGDLQLCFLTNNDITGGNSGSGMYDAKGRLIGLAFDGNWEAMSGDLKFDDRLQRTIGVDIRYVLSVIDTYSKNSRILKELTIEK